jgi:hypothetical protein
MPKFHEGFADKVSVRAGARDVQFLAYVRHRDSKSARILGVSQFEICFMV